MEIIALASVVRWLDGADLADTMLDVPLSISFSWHTGRLHVPTPLARSVGHMAELRLMGGRKR